MAIDPKYARRHATMDAMPFSPHEPLDDLVRVLGYVDAIDQRNDMHEVANEMFAMSCWTPQFCQALIRAAEAAGGFAAEPGLEPLQRWLARFLDSGELAAVMDRPWAERSAWRSPSWLYHLALRGEWAEARRDGSYRRSTRGRSLDEVGFIHLSAAHQVQATAQRFYGDIPSGELVLLSIDPQRLAAAGLAVMEEPAPGSGELFPHLYGALPLEAVLLAQPFAP